MRWATHPETSGTCVPSLWPGLREQSRRHRLQNCPGITTSHFEPGYLPQLGICGDRRRRAPPSSAPCPDRCHPAMRGPEREGGPLSAPGCAAPMAVANCTHDSLARRRADLPAGCGSTQCCAAVRRRMVISPVRVRPDLPRSATLFGLPAACLRALLALANEKDCPREPRKRSATGRLSVPCLTVNLVESKDRTRGWGGGRARAD